MPRRFVVLVTATALVGLPPTAAHATGDDEGSPGAPGIGDPYFPLDGNGGYDVEHYDVDVRYDPETDVLLGDVRITAAATQDLSAFNLDFEGYRIDSIRVDGDEAAWERDGGELTVVPEDVLDDGEIFRTRVIYEGVPQTIEFAFGVSGFMHTDDGALVAGQPDSAATWFPANDHPRDAATVSVSAEVPEGLEAVSNGALVDREEDDGWSTWTWYAKEPMATYLVTLAIGEFDIDHYTDDGIRFWDALDPDLHDPVPDREAEGPSTGEVAEASLGRQPEIIDFLEDVFGRYPFRTGGGIVDDFTGMQFALETQTRSIYSPSFFGDPLSGDLVVVHELAHQWIGDLVRVDEWRHIWLNEGFATYAEWLWLEREGVTTPQQVFDSIAAGAPPEFWQTTIGDPGASVAELFDVAVYYRGAMTLQALRQEVGDEAFFEIVEEWVSGRAGGTATTEQFVELAEKISGRQLDELFQAWLFTPGRPAGLS